VTADKNSPSVDEGKAEAGVVLFNKIIYLISTTPALCATLLN
jgi:hypothetical protein